MVEFHGCRDDDDDDYCDLQYLNSLWMVAHILPQFMTVVNCKGLSGHDTEAGEAHAKRV